MTLSKNIQAALSAQFRLELESAYVYLAMAGYCHSVELPGMAKWMRLQAREEGAHAMKLFDFIHEVGGEIDFQPIEKPERRTFESPLQMFEAALAHERKVTASIINIMNLAIDERDHATQLMLQWFVKEQVEEESSIKPIIHRLRMIGSSGEALYLADRDLGERSEGD